MNKIVILYIGKTDDKGLESATQEYYKRSGRYISVEEIAIPDIKNRKSLDPEEQKKREGELILSKLETSDRIILLDERGKERTSSEMAVWLDGQIQSSYKRMVLIIGGPYGFSDEVYAVAHEKIALSKLTFSHQMIRLFLAEQVYRWISIIKGLPYHHD